MRVGREVGRSVGGEGGSPSLVLCEQRPETCRSPGWWPEKRLPSIGIYFQILIHSFTWIELLTSKGFYFRKQ